MFHLFNNYLIYDMFSEEKLFSVSQNITFNKIIHYLLINVSVFAFFLFSFSKYYSGAFYCIKCFSLLSPTLNASLSWKLCFFSSRDFNQYRVIVFMVLDLGSVEVIQI